MSNPFKTFSFQVTFFFSFLLMSLLLIMLLGITSYVITNEEVAEETIHSRKLLLNEINKQLYSQMQAIEYDSLAIASSPKVIEFLQHPEESYERVNSSTDIIDRLSRLSYVKEGVQSVQLYAKNALRGNHVGANGVFPYSIVENSVWYGQIRDSDSSWVGAHQVELDYPTDEKTVVSFARKLYAISGKEIGILVINLKLSTLKSIVIGGTGDGSRYVLDSNNRLITEVTEAGKKGAASQADIIGKVGPYLDRSSSDGYAIADIGGKQLVIWHKQPNTGWVTMDLIAWDNVTKGSRRIQHAILMTALFCVLLAIGMAYMLSGQFVRPIRKLVQVMNKVKIGNLDIRISNDYKNEFGMLNDHFNHMIQRVRQLLKEVDEQNRLKREAELQVLQEQINPHFLYNTLDMINWHAIELGAREISRMLSQLGKMLRIGLSKGAAFVPVSREFEHLACYIELQKIRYRNRIEFSVSVPEPVRSCLIPKLIIQPFVENALLHGFRPAESGKIDIAARLAEGDLVVTIADNGHGMETDGTDPIRIGKGNGIRNVHERIRLYYGGDYGVRIESRPGAGTVVTIRVPAVASERKAKEGGEAYGESGHR